MIKAVYKIIVSNHKKTSDDTKSSKFSDQHQATLPTKPNSELFALFARGTINISLLILFGIYFQIAFIRTTIKYMAVSIWRNL